MIILCTADFNLCIRRSPVHEGDIKCAVDENEQYAQVIDRPEISEHASARIPEVWDTMRYDNTVYSRLQFVHTAFCS